LSIRNQLMAAWCVPVAMVLFGLSLVSLAHFVPPPAPTLSAEEVAAFFHEHSVGIRIAMTLLLFSGTLLAPITAVYSVLIRRIEGAPPILTYTQLITGTVALVLFIPPAICWTVAAYRPERAVAEILLLNDLGWFFFIMTVPPGILQVLVLGLAILQDRRRSPLFPRWLGYFNLWAAVLFIPGGVVSLFKTGPFAWNGLIAFWIPVAVFGAWWIIMFVMCLKAIRMPDESPASARTA
jgi:hypothetical protein